MMNRCIFGAVLAAFLACSAPAFAEELAASEGCMLAVAELDEFLLALPNTCTEDAECAGFYFRADTCSPAVMLPKSTERKMDVVTVLVQHQMNAREACKEDFRGRPVCKQPKPYKPACRENICVNEWAGR